MEKNEYQKLVDKHMPTDTRVQYAVIAFWIGGLVWYYFLILILFY